MHVHNNTILRHILHQVQVYRCEQVYMCNTVNSAIDFKNVSLGYSERLKGRVL